MAIGYIIKEIRKKKNITLADLSEKTNLSVGYLSNLERDLTSPTLVNLQIVCGSLDINLTDLLNDSFDPNPVVKKEERKEIFNIKSRVKYELVSEGTRSLRGICLTISEDYYEEEISWGHNTDEFGIVVKGSMCIVLDGIPYILNEGDSIYINSNTAHSYKKLSDKECISYWVLKNTVSKQT